MDAVVDFVVETLEDLVDHSVEDQVGDVVTVDVVVGLEVLIPWHAIGVGSVAIWPGIAPAPAASRWEVAQPALPVEHFPNPGKKAHNRGKGRGRQVRFGGLNVLYDDEGNSYPVDDARQLYVPLELWADCC